MLYQQEDFDEFWFKREYIATAKYELEEYAKEYNKTRDDFFGDRELFVEDYRSFLTVKTLMMMDSEYYKTSYLTQDDFTEIINAMCVEFRMKMRKKPEESLIDELRACARRLRNGALRPFRKDLVLYRVALTDYMYHHLRSLCRRLYGKSDALSPKLQAEYVLLLVASEMDDLKENGF